MVEQHGDGVRSHPALCSPDDTIASAIPLIISSLMFAWNPYHDDHPIGGTNKPLLRAAALSEMPSTTHVISADLLHILEELDSVQTHQPTGKDKPEEET